MNRQLAQFGGETVVGVQPGGQRVERRAVHVQHAAAVATDKMVVVALPGANLVVGDRGGAAGRVAQDRPTVDGIDRGENGGALRGTSQDFSGTHAFGANSPCFVVSPGQVVPMGYAVTLVSGTSPSCTAGWQQWSDAACTLGAGGAIGLNPTFPGAGYSAVTDSRTVGTGVVALELLVSCRGDAAFEVLIDNAYAVAPQPAPSIKTVPVPTLADLALAMLALALGAVCLLYTSDAADE